MSWLENEHIELLKQQIGLLKDDNSRLTQEINILKYEASGYRKAKKKRMKPKMRRKVRHLELIAVNGVPINGNGGAK